MPDSTNGGHDGDGHPAQEDASSLPGRGSVELRLYLSSAKSVGERGWGPRRGKWGAREGVAWSPVGPPCPSQAASFSSACCARPGRTGRCHHQFTERRDQAGQIRRLSRTLRSEGRKWAFCHVGKVPAPTFWGGNPPCAPGLSISLGPCTQVPWVVQLQQEGGATSVLSTTKPRA